MKFSFTPKRLMVFVVTLAFFFFMLIVGLTVKDQAALAMTYAFFMVVYLVAMMMLGLGKVTSLSLDVTDGKISINEKTAVKVETTVTAEKGVSSEEVSQ